MDCLCERLAIDHASKKLRTWPGVPYSFLSWDCVCLECGKRQWVAEEGAFGHCGHGGKVQTRGPDKTVVYLISGPSLPSYSF